jgi:hypothetical protein
MIKTKCLRHPKVEIPQWRARHDEKERDMPQIIVIADRGATFGAGAVTLRERVNVADFESQHFATQLVERLGWAVEDADREERLPAAAERLPPAEDRRTGAGGRGSDASDAHNDVSEQSEETVAQQVPA